MMMNLFSSFDPATSWYFPFNWLSMLIGALMAPMMYWFAPSQISMIWIKVNFTLHKEFKILMKLPYMGKATLMMISIFSMILHSNFMGMFPYIFTGTSHMVMTLSLALPMWLSFMIYGWLSNSTHMFTHLTPQGTPFILMPFMVCIETISNLIRPGTLAIRLSANMIAGHLLMTLMGNMSPLLPVTTTSLILLTQILLLSLELAVAIIQSYVFTVLVTLYLSEVN